MCQVLFRSLLAALLLMVAGASPLKAQSDADRVQAAAQAADQIFQLAAERRFNTMYDLIHPDAHAIVPRVVAVRMFEDIYEYVQAGRAEILDVRLEPYTWGVTGETYEDAAAIDYQQPYVENGQEQLLDDTMYLVEVDGVWRWFFGNSREFVASAIETYGGDEDGSDVSGPITEENLIEASVIDLEDFFSESLEYASLDYETPGVVAVPPGESVQTACGPAAPGFWAFYCPPDQTIYLDVAFLDQVAGQADFAAAFVIAHEWAHHVQTEIGLVRTSAPDDWNEVYSIELELQADCLAGVWALDLDTRGLLETGDIDETVNFAIQYLGDPANVNPYDEQAHGTAEQRAAAIVSGYENGFSGCAIRI